MLVIFALGGAVLALLVWVGRRPSRVGRPRRLLRALLAALAAAGAVVAGLRGLWVASLALVVVSAWLGYGQRRLAAQPPRTEPMSAARARSILGVGDRAGPAEIDAAYRRLMRRAHPDQGGSTGLAAELNAARDLLLK